VLVVLATAVSEMWDLILFSVRQQQLVVAVEVGTQHRTPLLEMVRVLVEVMQRVEEQL
jgi:hypothetical protein